MRKALISLTLSLAVFAPVAAFASPATYDAVADFSLSSNPNGVWSYGDGTPGSTFTAYSFHDSAFLGQAGLGYWGTGANNYNLVGLNNSGSAQTTYNPSSSELWMHPGPDANEATMVVFRAPDTANYDFSGLFERVDMSNGIGNGVGVTIYLNGSIVEVARTVLGTTYLDSSDFDKTIAMNAGDTLTFVVDNNGSYNNDSTGLQLSIEESLGSPVPEPSALLLFGTGILGIAGAARRRFFKA